MPRRRLSFHMIGNAHLDPAWMWQWPEGMQAFRATARAALARMEETPEFVFTCSQAAAYRWVERTEPELFAEIQKKVREGSWAIVGGWWVQPDCNLPGGEGFVRQALLGQRFFLKKFGRIADTGYCVDSFGHHANLPQILLGSGLRNYVFTRPGAEELPLPENLFWWEGPDGSRVLAYRIPYHYNDYDHTGEEKIEALYQDLRGRSEPPEHWMLFYGVGDHGGGPTREEIARIRRIAAKRRNPRVIFSDPERYFVTVRKAGERLPVVRHGLQYHAPGCYSAHSQIKRLNREAECWLLAAERWNSVAAQVAGFPYPSAELREAWEQVCLNHFHDILCGTSIREACQDAVEMYGRAVSVAKEAAHLAIQRIAARTDTSWVDSTREVQALLVFNPNAWDVDGFVQFEFWHDIHKSLWERPVHLRVLDSDGHEVPCQVVFASGKIGKDRIGIVIPAQAPALGYKTYVARYGEPSAFAEERPVGQSGSALENEHLAVELDPKTGWMTRLFDKRYESEVLSGPGARPVVLDDPTDTWGHGRHTWDDVVGVFSDAEYQVTECGPVRAAVRMRSFYNRSWIEQEFLLYRGSADIDVKVRIHWQEQNKMLKLEFPLNLSEPAATFEIPYAAIQGPMDGREVPGQSWFDVSGRVESAGGPIEYGLTIANNAKYSYSVKGSTMYLTVLRSPIYAFHEPHPLTPEQPIHYQDQGEHIFCYRLRPHPGNWRTAGSVRMAQELNWPLFPQLESAHPGHLARELSALRVVPDTICVTVLKEAEDGGDYILRCVESAGRTVVARFELPLLGRKWTSKVGGFEIKTFRIPRDKHRPVEETSLIEMELEGLRKETAASR